MDYLYDRLTNILCTLQEQDPNWQQRVGDLLASAGFDMQQVQPTEKTTPTGEPPKDYAARIVANFRR